MILTADNNTFENRKEFVTKYRQLRWALQQKREPLSYTPQPFVEPLWVELFKKEKERKALQPQYLHKKKKASKKAKNRTFKIKTSLNFLPSLVTKYNLSYAQFDQKTGHSRIRNPQNKRQIDFWNNGTIHCADGSWERKTNLLIRLPEELDKLR